MTTARLRPQARLGAGVLVALALVAATVPAGSAGASDTDSGAKPSSVPQLLGSVPATARRQALLPAPERMTRHRVVSLNEDLLPARAAGQPLALNLFDDASFVGSVDARQQHAHYTEWSGRLRTELGTWAAVEVDGVYMLQVASPEGVYQVVRAASTGDTYRVSEIDSSIPDEGDGDTLDPSEAVAASDDATPVGDATAISGGSRLTPTQLARTDGKKLQDVAVMWSPQAAAKLGGDANAAAYASLGVAISNQVYANSGVPFQMRLVGGGNTGVNEVGNFDTDLRRVTKGKGGYRNTHEFRNATHADAVSLMIAGNGSYCGIAWLKAPAPLAYSVVDPACIANFTMTHEIGHNQGAAHDKYAVSRSGSRPAFKFGYGYVNVSGGWRTVMAYADKCLAAGISSGCTRIGYMSNPKAAYAGLPVGAKKANNTKALRKTAGKVADFRQSQIYGKKVKLKGKAKKGRLLRAVTKQRKWTPGKVKIKFRWLLDGAPIKGKVGKKAKIRLKKKWKGHLISVRVTGKKKYYVPLAKYSKAKRVK